MIQTVDFFTPIVDDPYMFGQIAAANSLSDVWAMGGEPAVALNIVGFPNCLDPAILGDILSGFVHPDKIFKNYGCRPGDILVLTKQIGSGVVNTAIKADMASPSAIREAETVMASLNKLGKQVVEKFDVSACTDITGFGLLGHCVEMASASEVTFEINVRDIEYFADAIDYAKMGLVPAGAYKNRGYSIDQVEVGHVEDFYLDLLYDPQTSGGLLMSVAPENLQEMLADFRAAHMDTKISIIGKVAEKSDKLIRLY